MKCWPFLVLVLSSALEDTCAAPQQAYCPEPPEDRTLYRVDENADGDDSALVEGTVLRYHCGAGYASSGPPSVWNVTCRKSFDGALVWDLPNHSCRPISCGHPGDVWHGKLLGAVFSFPNRVTYQCDLGYELVGNADLYCQSDGNWNVKKPECRIVTCKPLDRLPNGHVETEGNEYGSTAQYHCERGFRLQGDAERQCGPEGLWTGSAPTCQEVTCPAPQPPGNNGTSSISRDAGPQRQGTVVHYSCPEPLVLVGSRSSTCLSVGIWSFDAPQCIPPCVVPKLGNAFIEEEEQTSWGRHSYYRVSPGTQLMGKKTLFLRCEEGYEYNGQSSTRIVCSNGVWDPPQPSCTEKPCRNLPTVKNASISLPVAHGTQLEYMCEEHYRLVYHGAPPHCHLGEVRVPGKLPECKQTFCNRHGFPMDATPLILLEHVFLDGEYLKYKCKDGFHSTHTKMKCTDGRWTAEENQPPCKPNDCRLEDIPKIENGAHEGFPNVTHNSVIRYICNDNYVLSGPESIRCLLGNWTEQRPSCVIPRDFSRHDVSLRRDDLRATSGIQQRAPEQHVSYPGSTAKSQQLRSCQFPERENRFHAVAGNVRIFPHQSVAHGTLLRFHCEPLGHMRLRGHESSECIDGRWSKELPYCYGPGRYDVVITVKDVTRTAVSPDGYLYIPPGTEAELECTSFYYEPRFEMMEALPNFRVGGRHSSWNITGRTYHVSAKFILYQGHEGIVRCSNDKDTQIIRVRGRYLWSCEYPVPSEATVVKRENREIFTVKCKIPYIRIGGERAYCLAHGEWRDPFPKCVLPARQSISNERRNANVHPSNQVPYQSAKSEHSKGPSNSTCKIFPIENAVYRRSKDPKSLQISRTKEFANGTVTYLHCRNDEVATEIRCLEGFWKPPPACPKDNPAAIMGRRINKEHRPNESDKPSSGPSPVETDPNAVILETSQVEAANPAETTSVTTNERVSQAPDARKIAGDSPLKKEPDDLNNVQTISTTVQWADVAGSNSARTSGPPDKIQGLFLPENKTLALQSGAPNLLGQEGPLSVRITATAAVVSPSFGEDLISGSNVTTGRSTASETINRTKSIPNPTINSSSTSLVRPTKLQLEQTPGLNQTPQGSCSIANFDSRVRAFVGSQRVDNFSVQIPHNTTVHFHCEPFGRTSGAVVEARCLKGQWTGKSEMPPRCDLLEGEPTVEITGASFEVGPWGELYVKPSPSSWIRFECKINDGPSGWQVLRSAPGENAGPRIHGSFADFLMKRGAFYELECHVKSISRRRITLIGHDVHFCTNPPFGQGVRVVHRAESELQFSCEDNLLLEGPEKLHCSEAGQWDYPPPRCVGPKKEPSCDLNHFLSRVPDGVVIEGKWSKVAAGTSFHAFCKATGYILDGQSRVDCDMNGTWSFDSNMKCKRSCAYPSPSPGVQVVRQTTSELQFACEGNLLLEGPEEIHCLQSGEWDKHPPVCTEPPTAQATGCEVVKFFDAVAAGVVIASNASQATVGAVYEAFCEEKGYRLKGQNKRVVCNADGTWDLDPGLTCVKGCENFAERDEKLTIDGFLPNYDLGDSITLTCPNGTALDPHVERITCLGDGWSEPELPRCTNTKKKPPKGKAG